MARTPFKMRSGNSSPFKELGSSPLHQEKHFLEKKSTIPMETHKGGDPNYKPTLKSKPQPKLKSLHPNLKQDINKPDKHGRLYHPPKAETKTKVTKGDVLQTLVAPNVNIKKTVKVAKHYAQPLITKGKEVIKKSSKYLKKGSGIIPNAYGKVQKWLESDA